MLIIDSLFNFCSVARRVSANGYVYETFGISKHFPVKLQALLIRAETFDNPLTAKCFIYDVSGLFFFCHGKYSISTPLSCIWSIQLYNSPFLRLIVKP